jgi:FlaA1/EpsC-like NDP-sugar epimerase
MPFPGNSTLADALPGPDGEVIPAFRDRTVLITGAAGSIGSELARQVSALPVARLILLDRDENSMFELTRSLELAARELPSSRPLIAPVIGDIRDQELIRHTFTEFQPDIVLHAAAYKHVPMMEANPCEAVLNNVTGTRILIDAAMHFGSERFLLISTDKAVETASVMGATKRLAELLIQQRAKAGLKIDDSERRTALASVRFVNVIGSRGSVVPIFRQQIEAGGPVTITDPRMTRFFMPVERAACLLLEAATLPDTGYIYSLETGDPVNIAALARHMIEAAGLSPDKDIAIEITGVRPGEKLSERLHGDAESLVSTRFRGIDRVHSIAPPTLDPGKLEELESAASRRDGKRVLELLQELPLDYKPRSSDPKPAEATSSEALTDAVAAATESYT